MTLTWGIIIAIVIIVLFVMLVATLGEGLVKITAKEANLDPAKFSVLPSDLTDILGRSKSKPDFVPADEQVIELKKGFDINLLGEAVIETEEIPTAKSATYAIKPKDFIGMSPIPKVVVPEGTSVKAGDPLFFDKKRPEIIYAAPVSGEMVKIQRGEKRSINEVVILADKEIEYRNYDLPNLTTCSYEELTTFLLGSGAWPFIRQRPFNIVADPSVAPKSIFVTTFDTAPLAPSFNRTVEGKEAEFQKGLDVLAKLTKGAVHLGLDARGEKPADAFVNATGVNKHWFKGAHPAGNVGVHIHHIDPVNSGESVWTLDVHGVLLIGAIFEKGIFDTERVVALTGAELANPTFVRAHQGICIDHFVKDVEHTTMLSTTDKEGKTVEVERRNVDYNKEGFMDNYYAFIQNVREEQNDFSTEDWAEQDERLSHFLNQCYPSYTTSLSQADKAGIWISTVFYLYARHGYKLMLMLNSQEIVIQQVLKELKGLDIELLSLVKTVNEMWNNPDKVHDIIDKLQEEYR